MDVKHDGGEGSKKGEKWVERRRDALMVVAGLMATMAFQAGMIPPGGLWQDDSKNCTSEATSPSDRHTAGYSILHDKDKHKYDLYIAFNSTGYVASLSIILLLVSGLPFFTKKYFVAILTVIIWVAISSMAVTYIISIIYSGKNGSTASAVLIVWGGLMVILILGHMIRVLVWIIKFLVRMIRKLCRCCGSN